MIIKKNNNKIVYTLIGRNPAKVSLNKSSPSLIRMSSLFALLIYLEFDIMEFWLLTILVLSCLITIKGKYPAGKIAEKAALILVFWCVACILDYMALHIEC